MTETRYGFGTTLRGIAFAEAINHVTELLKDEGFRRVVNAVAGKETV